MTKRTTESALARFNARVMCDHAEVRKVLAKLNEGLDGKPVTFVQACRHYRITPQQFWRRVRGNRELSREVAMSLMTQAWDRADTFSVDDVRALGTFVKLAQDMARALAPEDWGEKRDEVVIDGTPEDVPDEERMRAVIERMEQLGYRVTPIEDGSGPEDPGGSGHRGGVGVGG